jgi:hypothetical protein
VGQNRGPTRPDFLPLILFRMTSALESPRLAPRLTADLSAAVSDSKDELNSIRIQAFSFVIADHLIFTHD